MPRYIDADAMKDTIIRLRQRLDIKKCSNDFACGWIIGVDNMEGLIDTTPTADVVEVVRCKDCKRYSTELQMCLRASSIINAKPDDFCSYGKGKTL